MTESSNTEAGEPTPGIVERLARDDVERKRFLKMAGKRVGAGAAATSLAAFIAACGSVSSTATSSGAASSAAAGTSSATTSSSMSSSAASGSGDLAIVNYALTLEYLESQFYDKVIKSGLFHGKALSVLKTFGAEEADHVQALKTVAGQLGHGRPRSRRASSPSTARRRSPTLAATVENLGASAYLGQAGNIKSKEILAAALSIHTIEARHAATLNLLLKKSPTPDGAFAKPMSMAQVLAVVKPFIA